MKIKKIFAFVTASLSALLVCAETVLIHDYTGTPVVVDVPSEVATIINNNKASIENHIVSNGVSAATISSVSSKVTEAYGKLKSYGINSSTPITDAENGLNSISEIIVDAVPDSQMTQNVWAKAWLGEKFHMGGGINTGLTFMDISPLKDAANALNINTSKMPSSIPFPTITADLRASLPFFPMDIGATLSMFDTRKISGISSSLNNFSLEFFNLGFDIRYPLIKKGPLNSILSLGAGFYYSRGGIEIKDSDAFASMKYKAATFKIDAQYSMKLSVLVPFAGLRLALTQATSNWEIDANWASIYYGEAGYIKDAIAWGILPTHFSGGSSCSFTESLRPQIYGGIGLDVLCFDLTASAAFDFNTKIPSIALSTRISF